MDVFCKTTPTNSITIKLRLEDYDFFYEESSDYTLRG